MSWLVDNREIIGLAVQSVTAMVWVVYLQLLLSNFRRERRSKILITRVAGGHEHGHLMVGNMGAEPIFVKAVLADLEVDGQTYHSIANDSGGFAPFTDDDPSRSIKGPLKSADYRDLGRISDLVKIAYDLADIPKSAHQIEAVVVTVLAESSRDGVLVAGRQCFDVYHGRGHMRFFPRNASTLQLRSFRKRRELARRMDEMLAQEARAFLQGEDGKRPKRGADLGQIGRSEEARAEAEVAR